MLGIIELGKLKMKGAIVTGNIIDIIEILCILVLLMGMLGLAGFSLTDMFHLAGQGISALKDWFIGF